MSHKAAITITYCSQCNWMLRASWMAQELLHSFSTDIASVTLVPGTGGIFVVAVDDVQIWERKQDGGFPRCGGAQAPGTRCMLPGKTAGAPGQAGIILREYGAASPSLNVYYEYIFFGRNRRWRANVLRGKKRPLAA